MEKQPDALQWKLTEPNQSTSDAKQTKSGEGFGSTANLTASHPYAEVLDSIGKDCTQQVETYVAGCRTEQNGE